MSVEVLNSIKKQVSILTSQEKFVLVNYILEQTEQNQAKNGKMPTATNEIRQKRMAWLKANQAKYGGQFVVLDGDKLLGTAKTFIEGKKIAVESGVPDAFVNYLSKPNEDGYIGGW
jgi:hypothetical protein